MDKVIVSKIKNFGGRMKKFFREIANWIGTAEILAWPRSFMGRSLSFYYSQKGKLIFDFADYQNSASALGLDLIRKIKGETEMLLPDQEAYLLYSTLRKVEKIAGDVAEVGVYKGGSAKLMREATKKPLHLFDTFEGLPKIGIRDNPRQFQKGDYSASLESVKNYLKDCPDVFFYKGIFPHTAQPVRNHKFSFVHLDTDIYQSTAACLDFFYPRMNGGGVIISHDYANSQGVRQAFDDFFADKPEIIINPYSTGQALVVKI